MKNLHIEKDGKYWLLIDRDADKVIVKNASLSYITNCAYITGYYDRKIADIKDKGE